MSKLQFVFCFSLLLNSLSLCAQNLFEIKKNRLFGQSELGLYSGIGKVDFIGHTDIVNNRNNGQTVQIKAAVGYYFTEKIAMAVGTGIAKDFPIWPLYGELKYFLSNKIRSPFVSASYGKIILYDSGNFYEISVGYRMKFCKKTLATIRVGYNSTYWVNSGIVISETSIDYTDVRYNNLLFCVGLIF